MLINEVLAKVYPIYEANNNAAVKELGAYLDSVYNKQGSWTYGNVKPTMGEVAELYDVYKHIVHDHVAYDKITTISQNVKNILSAMGFNVKEKGVGWMLSEGTSGSSFTVKVTGYFDTYARTTEEAEYNIEDADFGDLENVTWEKDFEEDTMDGQRNDMVHVTYIVTGDLVIDASDKEQALEDAKDTDVGDLEETEFKLEESRKITESEDEDEDWLSDYLQKKGTYVVSAMDGEYALEPTGENKTFTDPGKAVEYWFKLNKKHPTCVAIHGYKKEAEAIKQWTLDNEDLVRQWAEKYNSPYKVEYLIKWSKSPVHVSNDKYPDQLTPYTIG